MKNTFTFRFTRQDGFIKQKMGEIPENDRSREVRKALLSWFRRKDNRLKGGQ